MKTIFKKKNSPVWNYFSVDPEDHSYAICKIPKEENKPEPCGQKCSRGGKDPSNFTNKLLKNHVEKYHPNEYKVICDNNEKKKSEGPKKDKKDMPPMMQPPFFRGNCSDNEITMAITKLFFQDGRPFSMVEDEAFKNLIKLMRPSYQIPHRTTFSKKQIPLLFNKTKEKILAKIQNQNPRCFSFSFDCWKSNADDHYIALSATFINCFFQKETLLLESMVFEKERQTAEEIAIKIENCLIEWKISPLETVAFTHDNGANVIKAVKLLKSNSILCVLHTFHLALKDALRENPDLEDTLSSIREVICHSNHSAIFLDSLKEAQRKFNLPKTKLIRDNITR